ncbi:hmr-1 [Cordylochernes scorpioides]|uniref:Hmr-1 n=1 Tax=Cordylochernes scorpioides TaxID=51811 RepID=A0ABY6KIT6_9ARAC|nr:hmr-1 [Cordylochernes scorpioides]
MDRKVWVAICFKDVVWPLGERRPCPSTGLIIEVKAKSFADREIRYTLRAQGKGAGTFNIGPTTGVVKLAKDLDYEDLRQPKSYSLIVTATEDSGGFSTSVEVSACVEPASFIN